MCQSVLLTSPMVGCCSVVCVRKLHQIRLACQARPRIAPLRHSTRFAGVQSEDHHVICHVQNVSLRSRNDSKQGVRLKDSSSDITQHWRVETHGGRQPRPAQALHTRRRRLNYWGSVQNTHGTARDWIAQQRHTMICASDMRVGTFRRRKIASNKSQVVLHRHNLKQIM